MLNEILLNKWFFTFVVGWAVFFLLIDWSKIYKNIWGGLVALILELWQDTTAANVGMYYIKAPGIWLLKSSFFLSFGIVFTMGILFLQYLPKKPLFQLCHIFVFSFGFVIFEITVINYALLEEPHWNRIGSFFDNIIIMAALAWLKQFVLKISKN